MGWRRDKEMIHEQYISYQMTIQHQSISRNRWVSGLLLTVLLGLSTLLTGCINDDALHEVAVERVLLVYLGGDNDLAGESQQKLDALQKGFDGARCRRVLVYIDSKDQAPTLVELTGENQQTVLQTYAEENSADAAVFQRVIQQCRSRYPQATHNLLLFSHASGWLPEGSYNNPASRSILVDEGREMELRDLAAAIPPNSFESIVFETCHMAGIEVFYELRNKARWIAGSSAEIVAPGFTDLYSTPALNDLVKGDVTAFMDAVFTHVDAQTGVYHSGTLSLVETAGLPPLASFIQEHCQLPPPVAVNEVQGFDRYGQSLFFDFEDYYARGLATEAEKQTLRELLNQTVVWKKATPYFMQGYNGFAINKHSGMTCYIPQAKYTQLNKAYLNLQWAEVVAQ